MAHSTTSVATNGALSDDIDAYMSVKDYEDVKFDKFFAYGGVDSNNFNVGYGGKIGGKYLGVYYSGNLIDNLYSELTNGDNKFVKQRIEGTQFTILDMDDKEYDGHAISRNNVVFFFVPKPGTTLKIGFNQFLDYTGNGELDIESTGASASGKKLTTSFLPFFELGVLQTRGALKDWRFIYNLAIDIHADRESGYIPLATSTYTKSGDYTQPSFTFTLDRTMKTATGKTSFGGSVSLDTRLYNNSVDDTPTFGALSYNMTPGLTTDSSNDDKVTRFPVVLSVKPNFSYSGMIGKRMNYGIAANVLVGVSIDQITSDSSLVEESDAGTAVVFQFKPQLGIGAKYYLVPGRLAVQGGVGANLFEMTATSKWSESTMPYLSLAAGLSIGITENSSAQMLIKSSGANIDASDLGILFSLVK